jgi:hypothetical protein
MAYILNQLDLEESMEQIETQTHSRNQVQSQHNERVLENRPSRHSRKSISPPASASSSSSGTTSLNSTSTSNIESVSDVKETSSSSSSLKSRIYFENPTDDQLLFTRNIHKQLLEEQTMYSNILSSGGFVPGSSTGEYESDSDEMSDSDLENCEDAVGTFSKKHYIDPEKARKELGDIQEQLNSIPKWYPFERVIHQQKAKDTNWKPHIQYEMVRGVTQRGTRLYQALVFLNSSKTEEPLGRLSMFPSHMKDILECLTMFYSM